MARYDKLTVLGKMCRTSLVPVFCHTDADTVCRVVKACFDGGVEVFEFTNRSEAAHEVFREVACRVRRECPGLSLGAGSVVDEPTAALYIQSGADFIVSPLFRQDVAKLCNRRGIPYIAGCGSVTEIGVAQEAGCDIVKVFPGEVLGPAFVKAVLAPMPWTRIMVTGGVQPDKASLSAWLSAGACCVGMGSKLFPKDRIEAGDWEYITGKCRECADIIKGLKA